MLRFCVLFGFLSTAGCGQQSTGVSSPSVDEVSTTVPVAADRVAPVVAPAPGVEIDPKRDAFVAAVADYLGEARAGAKLLGLAPTLADLTKKDGEIREVFIHLPDVPAAFSEHRDTLEKTLKKVNVSFFLAVAFAQSRDQARQFELAKSDELAKKSTDLIRECRQLLREAADDIRERCEQIETVLNN